MVPTFPERDADILRRRDAGQLLSEIAFDLGISRQRVQQLDARARKKREDDRAASARRVRQEAYWTEHGEAIRSLRAHLGTIPPAGYRWPTSEIGAFVERLRALLDGLYGEA